ncbi:hypothetical protein [Serratia inhibens]|uniref:hypothetical protein n=1 Tax=Serratia inhibens TaxID=2338073 RepID=UPI003217B57E
MKKLWFFLLFFACTVGASEIKELDRWSSFIIDGVTIEPDKDIISIHSDKKIHVIAGKKYFLLIKGYESRPGYPLGRCGAGQEMYADIYQVNNKKSFKVQRVLIVSCRGSIEQFSRGEDGDFSSITWTEKGVTFDWIVPPNFTNLKAQLNLDSDAPELVFIP